MSAASTATAAADGGSASSLAFGRGGGYSSSIPPARLHAHSAYLAGDVPVAVVPSFRLDEPLGLIGRPVGPFRPGVATDGVPLWLACTLRRRNLCRLVPPSWLDVGVLRDVLAHERDPDRGGFSDLLPFRHAEIARAILGAVAGGSGGGGGGGGAGGGAGGGGGRGEVEVPDLDQVRLLLEDVATVRMDKIRRNVHTLSAQSMAVDGGEGLPVIDVTGIGSMEMHAVMPFVAEAFRTHRTLTGRDGDGAAAENHAGAPSGRRVRAEAAMAAAVGGGGGGGGGGEDGVVYANPGVIPPPISRPDIIDNAGHDGGHDVDDEDSEDEDELEEPTPRKPSRLRRFR